MMLSMKRLNENIFYLYNKWKEGYVRKETALEEKIKPMKEWAKKYFYDTSEFEYTIDGIIVNGNLKVSCGLRKFDFPFVECNGNFIIEDDFESLKNCPRHVTGDFKCCNIYYRLTSLVGAPEEVGGTFDCNGCHSLSSLKGAPKKVKNFDCSLCDLKSLVGAPEIVTGDFTCWNSALLTTLNGAPEKVGGDFDCSCCDSLKSIKSLPKEIGGDLHIDGRFKGKIPKDVIIKGNIEYE